MRANSSLPFCGSGPSILFEPYFQIMNFEFCVVGFSICDGLGSALWLRENKRDGAASNRIRHEEWVPSLVRKFDPAEKLDLSNDVNRVRKVRDKLHQDRLGARENIDWHAFSYADAFTPAIRAIRCLLQTNAQDVPPDKSKSSMSNPSGHAHRLQGSA